MPSISQLRAEAHGPARETSTPAKTLWQLLQEGVDRNPDGLALACPPFAMGYLFPPSQVNSDPRDAYDVSYNGITSLTWSYNQLSSYAEHLACKLREYGAYLPGATIVPFLASGPDWALVFWAAAKLHMPIAAVDPKVLSSETERFGGLELQDSYLKTLHPHIVVVEHDLAAAIFDEACGRNDHIPFLKIIVDPKSTLSHHKRGGWINLNAIISSDFMSQASGPKDQAHSQAEPDLEAVARILFTGGSTGTPKGCPHTHINLTAESCGYNAMRGLTTTSRTLVQSPAHHIMANAAALLSWRAGGCVVLPFLANRFDAGQSIQAIKDYSCTYLPVHHSMSDSILRHPDFNQIATRTVRYMQIGGALIGHSLVERYRDAFGVAKDGTSQLEIFPFWGSTEGMYTTVCAKGDRLITDRDFITPDTSKEPSSDLLSVGRAYVGGRVKVVHPDNGATMLRGQTDDCVGELHFGGDTVITRYMGGRSMESFYIENGCSWFKTGDQGRMATDGSIFMLGRYKDMIKRGGENIFPQQLEYKLQNICSVKAQIIGIPDDVTGEACVAVVDPSKSEHFTKLQLQLDVSKYIGPEFVFAHILTLEDLGLAQFPVGPGGKVRKPVLRQLILEHLENDKHQVPHPNGKATSGSDTQGRDDCVGLVKSVWADLLHVDPAELDEELCLKHFADSLTAMRYCFEIERLTSKRLTVAEVQQFPTIKEQAEIIAGTSSDIHVAGHTSLDLQQRTGPPSLKEIVVCRGDLSKYSEIQAQALQTLARHGLTWEKDVEDCFGALPLWAAMVLLPASRTFNLRFAFEVHGLQFLDIREALVETLKVQPLLASTGITLDNKLVYLQLRQTRAVIDRIITQEREFGSVDAAVEWGLHEPFELVAHPPEMVSRFGVSLVSNNDKIDGPVHVINISLSHTVCDGMTNSVLIGELEAQILRVRAKMTNRAAAFRHSSPRFLPYKYYCDMYNSLANSVSAKASAATVASKFRGICAESGTAWPLFDPNKILSFTNPDPNRGTEFYRGGIIIQRSLRVSGILSLQDTHGVPPSVPLKVAYALAVMQMTGKMSALFARADAARHWPFQDEWTQTQLPNPLLVGGPTVVVMWDRLKLEDDQVSLLEIFRRVQAEDSELAPHTHVFNSHETIIAELPAEDALFVRETRCFDAMLAFNHVPDVGRFTGADGLKAIKFRGSSFFTTGVTALQCGFDAGDRESCVIAGLVDETKWEDAQREVGGFEEKILRTLSYIVRPQNWNVAAAIFAAPTAAK